MTVLYTRWRFDNYTKKGEFYIGKKIMKKFVKLCLLSSYIVQNSFHFDEIFHKKNYEKIIVKVCLRSSYTLQNSFHFDKILHRKYKIPFDAI